jgi:hypothetical protein
MESPASVGLIEKLKALNLLKDALGPMYEEHKKSLLAALTTMGMVRVPR